MEDVDGNALCLSWYFLALKVSCRPGPETPLVEVAGRFGVLRVCLIVLRKRLALTQGAVQNIALAGLWMELVALSAPCGWGGEAPSQRAAKRWEGRCP